ncbi:MAG: glycerol kinase, partial [Bacteroidota bacterium]
MQFQSDLLHVEVERPVMQETTALGAAYLAGLAVGFWKNTTEIVANRQVDKTFKPAATKKSMFDLYRGWKKAVSAARKFK